METLIGVFGITEDNTIAEKAIYPSNPKQISAAIDRQSSGEVTKELAQLIEKLKQRGFDRFILADEALAGAVGEKYEVLTEVQPRSGPSDYLRENIERLAVEYGSVEDTAQFYQLSHEVSTLRTKRAVREAQSKRDTVINQTVQLLNELDKTLNVLSGKLSEWYGLHFPELGSQVESHETYARMVERFGDRADFDVESLVELGFKERKALRILRSANDSMGAPLERGDLEQMRGLVTNLLSLYAYRETLEAHITVTATEVAPNLSHVAGPVLAAKLIEKAGGIRKLAMMPSSTIQILGAEKALFRAKKTGSKPPKHGLIFQHPFVHSKKRKLRGRASRVLSSKLAIAARADAFSGNPIGVELRKQLKI